MGELYMDGSPVTVAANKTTGSALLMRAMRDMAGCGWAGKSKRGRAPPKELVVMMMAELVLDLWELVDVMDELNADEWMMTFNKLILPLSYINLFSSREMKMYTCSIINSTSS